MMEENYIIRYAFWLAVMMLAVNIPNSFAQPVAASYSSSTGSNLIPTLETKLKHPLTIDQRQQLRNILDDAREKLNKQDDIFVSRAAQATVFSSSRLKNMVKSLGSAGNGIAKSVINNIENSTSRPLTGEQRTAIVHADEARVANIKKIQAEFSAQLSAVTGLTDYQVKGIKPAAGR